MFRQSKAFYKRLLKYFSDYGGLPAVLGSPLFHISFFITVMNYHVWMRTSWVETVQSMLPNLLGFSLGTYAILFSLIENNLRRALNSVEAIPGVSYMKFINATFFHFIFIQVLAMLWAIVYSGTLFYDIYSNFPTFYGNVECFFKIMSFIGAFFGYFLFVYSISLTVGAALVVYRLASIKRSD